MLFRSSQPKPTECGDRRICAGPVTITLPGDGRHGVTIDVALPGLPIEVGVGPGGVIVGTKH